MGMTRRGAGTNPLCGRRGRARRLQDRVTCCGIKREEGRRSAQRARDPRRDSDRALTRTFGLWRLRAGLPCSCRRREQTGGKGRRRTRQGRVCYMRAGSQGRTTNRSRGRPWSWSCRSTSTEREEHEISYEVRLGMGSRGREVSSRRAHSLLPFPPPGRSPARVRGRLTIDLTCPSQTSLFLGLTCLALALPFPFGVSCWSA